MSKKPTLSSVMTQMMAKSAIAMANNPFMKATNKIKTNFSKAALKNMALSTVMATSLINGMMPSAQATFFSEDQIDNAGGVKKMMMQGANFVSDHPILTAGMAAGTMGLIYAFAPYIAASMFGDPSEFATSTAGKLLAGDTGSAMDQAMAAPGMMSTFSNVLWNTAKFGIPTIGGIWGLDKMFGKTKTAEQPIPLDLIDQDDKPLQSRTNITLKYGDATPNQLQKLFQSMPNLREIAFDEASFENASPQQKTDFKIAALEALTPDQRQSIEELDLNFLDYKKLNVKMATFEASTLGQKQSIEMLDLTSLNYELEDQDIKRLSAILATMPQLKKLNLNLENNNLTDQNAQDISQALSKMTNLTTLELNFGYNKTLGNKGTQAIAQALSNMTNLTTLELDFGTNPISGQGVQHISQALERMTTLKTLKLTIDECQLTDQDAQHITQALAGMINLTTFELNAEFNKLNNNAATHLAHALKKMTKLTTLKLNLESSEFGIDAVERITQALEAMTELTTLELNLAFNREDPETNGLAPESSADICRTLKKMTNLTTLKLNLSNDQLEDVDVEGIINALQTMPQLTTLELNLKNNNIDYDGSAEALTRITQIKTLTLTLDGNPLDDVTEQNLQKLAQQKRDQGLNWDITTEESEY